MLSQTLFNYNHATSQADSKNESCIPRHTFSTVAANSKIAINSSKQKSHNDDPQREDGVTNQLTVKWPKTISTSYQYIRQAINLKLTPIKEQLFSAVKSLSQASLGNKQLKIPTPKDSWIPGKLRHISNQKLINYMSTRNIQAFQVTIKPSQTRD